MSDLTASSDVSDTGSGVDPYRLPRTAIPSRYDLTIEPDLASFTFEGSCITTIEVTEQVDRIVCNAIELDITRAGVVFDDGRTIEAVRMELDEAAERVTFHFDIPIEAGTRVLHTEFLSLIHISEPTRPY